MKGESERGLSVNISQMLKVKCNKDISACSNEEIYFALLEIVQNLGANKVNEKQEKKKLYYISAEFLIGNLLSNNLINLGIYDEVKEILANNGKNISESKRKRNYIIYLQNF